MNKSDLISHIAEKTELTNVKTAEVLEVLLETITNTISTDKITLIGFGTFETLARAARVGRNPKTGEELKIKATVVPKFKPGKALKDAVAGHKSDDKRDVKDKAVVKDKASEATKTNKVQSKKK